MLTANARFPEGFLFGTATSACQIAGHAFGGACRTHRDDCTETSGNVVGAETGARACDHGHLRPQDLDLIAAANLDVHRISARSARVLAAVQRAIAQGVNVQGACCRSRLDNYEWSLGYEKRVGLVHVAFDSLKRVQKSSYLALARAMARNAAG